MKIGLFLKLYNNIYYFVLKRRLRVFVEAVLI